jgi:hypothetical protein
VFAVNALHHLNTWCEYASLGVSKPQSPLNTSIDALAYVSLVLVWHVAGYIIVIAVLAACTPTKHDAQFVFTTFQNRTGWDNDFVSWSVSLLAALYAFFSLDSTSHFSEEIEKANIMVPRASKSASANILLIYHHLTRRSGTSSRQQRSYDIAIHHRSPILHWGH